MMMSSDGQVRGSRLIYAGYRPWSFYAQSICAQCRLFQVFRVLSIISYHPISQSKFGFPLLFGPFQLCYTLTPGLGWSFDGSFQLVQLQGLFQGLFLRNLIFKSALVFHENISVTQFFSFFIILSYTMTVKCFYVLCG